MKKFLAVEIVAVIMAIGFFSMAVAETKKREYTIIGYGSEQFAVVDDIRRQVNEMAKSWGTKKIARIIIHGFADKKGKAAENEVYALKRAQEMKSLLETRTDAKITALSEGDSEDARKVVIEVWFAVALPPASLPVAQPQGKIFKVVLYLSAIALVVLLLNILIDRRSRQASILKVEEIKVQEIDAKKKLPKQPAEPTIKWVEIDGYYVRIENIGGGEDGRWYSPFTNTDGSRIFMSTEAKIIGSVRRCLNNPKFSEQVKSLKETGLISPL